MHFFFPASDVFVTAIPKTGCTSVLNFMYAVEESITTHAKPLQGLEYLPDFRQIHMPEIVSRFRVDASSPRAEDAAVRFATLRNPVDRALSCWVDKFVLAQGFRIFEAFYDRPWFPWNIRSVDGISCSLDLFLRELETSPGFLLCNPHWAPQSELLLRNIAYDFFAETTQFHGLPGALARYTPQMALFAREVVPRCHTSESNDLAILLTVDVVSRLHAIYEADYRLLDKLGMSSEDLSITDDTDASRATADEWLSRNLVAAQTNRILALRALLDKAQRGTGVFEAAMRD